MAKEYAEPFYNSKEWKRTRQAFMQSKNYICERCENPARIAHHKTYITPQNIMDLNITLNWDNLECLCQDCHTIEHHAKPITAPGLCFDSNGDLIQL